MILEAERAAPFVTATSTVIDLGASIGDFTEWAAGRGARVLAVEPEPENLRRLWLRADYWPRVTVLPCAAGPAGWARLIVPENPEARATGCITIPDSDGCVWAMPLDSLIVSEVDVLKCDIQGAEFDLFAAASDETLRRCRLITIERHAWTTPEQEPVEGWGVVDGPPMPPDAWDELAQRMSRTHRVEEEADLLYCYREGRG